MYIHKIAYSWLALALGLLLSACSTERTEADLAPQRAEQEAETYSGPVTELSLDLEAALEQDEVRALDGLEFGDNGRLFPASANGQVRGVIVLANASSAHTTAELTFSYDRSTRRATYKGQVRGIPTSVLTGEVKARIIVYPEGSYNANTRSITMPQQFAPQPAAGQSIGIKIPYFSGWKTISVSANESLPTDIKGLTLQPQGQIIRLQVTSTQTEVDDARLHKFIFESNVMSRSGSYSLALSNSSAEPAYTPARTEQLVSGTSYYRYDVKPTSPQRLQRGTPQTYYLWVEARPGVAQPYTRTLISVQYMDPVLDPTTDNWWVGKVISEAGSTDDYKLVATGYNNSTLQGAGATWRLTLSNRNGFTPLSRMAFYYMSAKADQNSVNFGMGELDTAPALIDNFEGRFNPGHTRYSLGYLLDNGYLPTTSNGAYTQISTLRSSQYKDRGQGLLWRIPTIRELRVLLPTYKANLRGNTEIFNFSTGTDGTATASELLIDGDNTSYGASYSRTGMEVDAIRFLGNNDQHKCWYMYRYSGGGGQSERTQVQARYLGKYYPEIRTADDFKSFKGILPTVEERVIAWNLYYQANDKGMKGNNLWVRTTISSGGRMFYYRIKLDHNTGFIGENGFGYSTANRNQTGVVLLIRDFKS